MYNCFYLSAITLLIFFMSSCKTIHEIPSIEYDYSREKHVKEFHYSKSNFWIAKTLDTSSPAKEMQVKYYKRIPKAIGVRTGLRSILYNDLGSSDLISSVQLLNSKQKDKITANVSALIGSPYLTEVKTLSKTYTLQNGAINYEINEMIIPHGTNYLRICSITYDGYDKKIYPYLENEIVKPLKSNVTTQD